MKFLLYISIMFAAFVAAMDLDSIRVELLVAQRVELNAVPIEEPTVEPTQEPSAEPTASSTIISTSNKSQPSSQPSSQPTSQPSAEPTSQPTGEPSLQPTMIPTTMPSGQPSNRPTQQPSIQPTSLPSAQPSAQPSSRPTALCSTGWLQFGYKCYYFSNLTNVVDSCRSYCTAKYSGSTLPCIVNAAENSFIANHQQGLVFIDYGDSATEGTYQWGSGCSSSYTSWAANEPTGGVDANVVIASGGTWYDAATTSEQNCACEYALPTPSPSVTPTIEPTLAPSITPSITPTVIPTKVPTLAPTSPCPTGWVFYGYKCYYFPNSRMTFADCQVYCPAQVAGATLLCVENAAENAFLYPQIRGYTYLDLTDAVTEQTWVWGSGCSSTYFNFNAGEGRGGTGENNAIYYENFNPTWADYVSSTNVYCACQYGVLPTALPTTAPSSPTANPTCSPTRLPTTAAPTKDPTFSPTCTPTKDPTAVPTGPTQEPTMQPTTFCAAGWKEYDYKCYSFNFVSMSYAACLTYCPTLRADATTLCIESAGQNSFIAANARSTTWVGLSDEVLEGTFVWFEGCGAQYTNWGSGEPNNSGNEDHTNIAAGGGTWNDIGITSTPYCACEYPGGPTRSPTAMPSRPTANPTIMPSRPTTIPTLVPTVKPTAGPTITPTAKPSAVPTSQPSRQPTAQPVVHPTAFPSSQPSTLPTMQPSSQPSAQPVLYPTAKPSVQPSSSPTTQPSTQPSGEPTSQPSIRPSALPSSQPSSQPSRQPVFIPTSRPSSQPSVQPSRQPSVQPSTAPTSEPSAQPSNSPTCQPAARPTSQPSGQPSAEPSGQPSDQPTTAPSSQPRGAPSSQPSSSPTRQPSSQPSSIPSTQPSEQPTLEPSAQPSDKPSAQPSTQPSGSPSSQPSSQPTGEPTSQPSLVPSAVPTAQPSGQPSQQPSCKPSGQPSLTPSTQPTASPTTEPSAQPSTQPSTQPSVVPTNQPSSTPSSQPSSQPSSDPTGQPSVQPSCQPSQRPSARPSSQPSGQPSCSPTNQPSTQPSGAPSSDPTGQPSLMPSSQPSSQPSSAPTTVPTTQPSTQPTSEPSGQPSRQPTHQPTSVPSTVPTVQPSSEPSKQPTSQPSGEPTSLPTQQPSAKPSTQPTSGPSSDPTAQPSQSPTTQPSAQPTANPTSQPSVQPSLQPSSEPTAQPTIEPSAQPTLQPSASPSVLPSSQPSTQPTAQPSGEPSSQPSAQPSTQPSGLPSSQPRANPTSQPSTQPTERPSMQPSVQPSSRPTGQPSTQPSRQPSGEPTSQPTVSPSVQPTSQPSSAPSAIPSSQPSTQPTERPSGQPSAQPSGQPTVEPSAQPTGAPSAQPSGQPSGQPTYIPSVQPSSIPSTQPSSQPSTVPSCQPTSHPSAQPTSQPSAQPSVQPSLQPTSEPTAQPSAQPTDQPSTQPSIAPSRQPTTQPSTQPSGVPSMQPTAQPSIQPSNVPSGQPSTQPTKQPSSQPSVQPSSEPTAQPTVRPSEQPSEQPSGQPSRTPSVQPSAQPTSQPSTQPSGRPSMQPSLQPSSQPSGEPSAQPSAQPTEQPSGQPSSAPSSQPTVQPSIQPSSLPSSQPSVQPSSQPSRIPSSQPSVQPSAQPSSIPSSQPSEQPTSQPSAQPSGRPSMQPSLQPSSQPSGEPSAQPSVQPTEQPSGQPSNAPSSQPTVQPSTQPSSLPSSQPSVQPSSQPSSLPSSQPSVQPSTQPSDRPSLQPSNKPSSQPSDQPTSRPSTQPSTQPSLQPTGLPSVQPTSQPTDHPSGQPSSRPSRQPTAEPSAQPTVQPSDIPSGQPSAQPSSAPSAQPTRRPSGQPSTQPSFQPSGAPTSPPSTQPSGRPSMQPSAQPSALPTMQPSIQPSVQPTRRPTGQPSSLPSGQPTAAPSTQPTSLPTAQPSTQPSSVPSSMPTSRPTGQPTMTPTHQPSAQPSIQPQSLPSSQPSIAPSVQPTVQPSSKPSSQPTRTPTAQPSVQPSTTPTSVPSSQPSLCPSSRPTVQPSALPTSGPTSQPSSQPSRQPSGIPSVVPTSQPSSKPSTEPSAFPSVIPTGQPSRVPSACPSALPSVQPTVQPSSAPSGKPSSGPTSAPTAQPSHAPTGKPTKNPSSQPSTQPSCLPSSRPSSVPSATPSAQPSALPSARPTKSPSSQPSSTPTTTPSSAPSAIPSAQPTRIPSGLPSAQPTRVPSNRPSSQPTARPTARPSMQPSRRPTSQPSGQPSSRPINPTMKPSRRPSAKPTMGPTKAGAQVYFEGTQSMKGMTAAEFEANIIAVMAWKAAVAKACSPDKSELLRVDIKSYENIARRALQAASVLRKHSVRLLSTSTASALRINFAVSYSLADFKESSVNATTTAMKSSYQQSVADQTFSTNFASEIVKLANSTEESQALIETVTPAEVELASSFTVVETTAQPSFRPSAAPTTFAPTVYWKAPVIGRIVAKNTKDTISLDLTFSPQASYPGRAYCAAYLNSVNLTSVNQVVSASTFVSYAIGSSATGVAFTGLKALSNYVTYCYLETTQGVGNSLKEVLATKRSHTTACCRSVTFTNAPSEVYGSASKYPADQTSRFVFSFALSGAPLADLLVTPIFTNSDGVIVSTNVVAASPASFGFSASSSTLTGSFVLSVDSASFNTGSYVLSTKLTGGSSSEYYAASTAVKILSVRDPPSPPKMSSAVFSSDGSSLLITFDSATDQSLSSGSCALLFTFLGADKTTCTWTSNSQVKAVFAAYDGTVAYAAPGDPIVLQEQKIKAKCIAGDSCSSYATSPSGSVNAQASSSSLRPSVVVSVPRSVAACANVSVDASTSSGHGGRPWLSVAWTVVANVPGTDTTEISTRLNSLGTTLAQVVYFRASRYAVSGVQYSLSMTATNFLGQSSSSSAQFALSGNPNLPTVKVLGDTYFTVTPTNTLTVYASSSKSICAEKSVTFSTTWRLYTIDGTPLNVQSQSKDPSVLILAPRSLSPGQRYLAEVTTLASASATNPAASATASAYITVLNGNVMAVVSGGDTRQVLAEDVVFIDASNSYDENTGAGVSSSSLRFQWSCTYLTTSRFGASCSSVIIAGTTTNRRVSVNGLALNSAESYSFKVVVTAADGRAGSKAVAVTVQDAASSTRVFINDPPVKVNSNSRLVLTAQLSAQYALVGTWSALSGGTAFPITTSTPQTVTFSAQDAIAGIQFALLIPGDVLSAGSTVTFRLLADRVGVTSTKYQSYSEVSVMINAPPSSGSFVVDPLSGEALTKPFRLTAGGWTDSPEDLPLSYMFSYTPNLESGELVLQSRQGTNTVSSVLPSGSQSLEYVVVLSSVVYDTLLASTSSSGSATVTPPQSASALDSYVEDSLNSFAATKDTSQATQLINNVATTINAVNCSLASAAFCASKNRRPCVDEPNTCSGCLAGFSGVVGSANSKCHPTSGRRLSSQDGDACVSNDDCLLGNCVDSACAPPTKLCPSSDPETICSGNGECVYSDSGGNVLDKTCTVYDTDCFAACACSGGMAGYDCSLTADELQSLDSTRQRLCETFVQVAALSNPSASLLESLVGSLSASFDPAQVVSNASYTACAAALKVVTALAADGFLKEASAETMSTLVQLTGMYTSVANTTAGYDGSLVTAALADIAQGVLDSMVNGQRDISIAYDTLKFSATKVQAKSLTLLTPPSTAAEEAYGQSVTALLELLGDAGSACDAGSGYVDMSITQWGVNPYPGASQLDAPQIRLEARVASEGTQRRRLLQHAPLDTVEPVAPVSASPSYFVTFVFNVPQVFTNESTPDSSGSNVTFPECTVYDPQSSTYVPCDSCKVSSYTHTNVTFACYNVSNLCNASAASGSTSRRLLGSLHQRSLATGDDAYDDDGVGSTSTGVSSIQYSALVSTAGGILATNPFSVNFRTAKVIISFVAALFAIVVGGMYIFRRWDIQDHNMFLYKHKELPHLRIDPKTMEGLPATTSLAKFQSERFGKNTRGRGAASTAAAAAVSAAASAASAAASVGATVGATVNDAFGASPLAHGTSFFLGRSPSKSPASPPLRRIQPTISIDDEELRMDTNKVTFSMKSEDSSLDSVYESSKSMGSRKMSKFRNLFGLASDEEEEETEEKFLRGVIANYISAVIPLDFTSAKETTWVRLINLLDKHPVSELLFHPSLQQSRVLRWAALCMDIMAQLFIDTLFFSTFYPDAGECEAYDTHAACVLPQNKALSVDLCTWHAADPGAHKSEGHCSATPPPTDLTFTMVLVMLTILIALPLTFLFDYVMTEYCSKRPDFARWGWNTEAILGRSTQSLGEFTKEKLLSPIVSLRKEVVACRASMGEAGQFHSEEYKLAMKNGGIDITAAPAAANKSAENAMDADQEARAVYDEFISVADEVEQMLHSVILFLTVTLRKQKVRWESKAGVTVAEGLAIKMNAEKVQVIEEAMLIRSDGSPVPLNLWDRLFYKSPKEKLQAAIRTARREQKEIGELLDSLGETEVLSKDEALTQFFILEQFSAMKQYALRSQLFDFAMTTALPIDPGAWLLGWAFYLSSYLFFFYWALVWGLSTSDSTVAAWGTNFAIAVGQDMLFVQTFRLYVLYMISTITIKPQLTAIYTTLQRLAVEYVQDELPEAYGVIKVVQHLSPACRVAKMKVSDNLAAGQILRHIDDRDIRNFRLSSNLKLPMLLFVMVAIPVIIGAVDENVGQLLIQAIIPSLLDMLVVAHYKLYQQSEYWIIVPYSLLILYFLTRERLYKTALERMRSLKARRREARFEQSNADWRKRSGIRTRKAGEARVTHITLTACLTSTFQIANYGLRRTWTSTIDGLAWCVYYAAETDELMAIWEKRWNSTKRMENERRQWRNLNMPASAHGIILSQQVRAKIDSDYGRTQNMPDLHPEIQSLSRDVTVLWDPEQGHSRAKGKGGDCTTATRTYLQRIMGLEDLKYMQPASLSADDADAEIGRVLYLAPLPDRVGSDDAHEMSIKYRTKTGYCRTVEKALVRVVAQYRDQVLDGKIKYIYLLDEELLLSALTPQEQLLYPGQVHVRDLQAMLEEMLFFYRPHGEPLSAEAIQATLVAFRKWAARNWQPMDDDVRHGVQTIIAPKHTGWGESNKPLDDNEGFFRQHNLVLKAKRLSAAKKNSVSLLPPAALSSVSHGESLARLSLATAAASPRTSTRHAHFAVDTPRSEQSRSLSSPRSPSRDGTPRNFIEDRLPSGGGTPRNLSGDGNGSREGTPRSDTRRPLSKQDKFPSAIWTEQTIRAHQQQQQQQLLLQQRDGEAAPGAGTSEGAVRQECFKSLASATRAALKTQRDGPGMQVDCTVAFPLFYAWAMEALNDA